MYLNLADLRAYLQGQGIASPIQLMVMDDSPDEVIALYDTGGFPPDNQSPLRDPTVQVLARAPDFSRAKELAEQVFASLHNASRLQLGAAFVYECTALQEPTPIGQDGTGRWKVTCNYHFKTRSVS